MSVANAKIFKIPKILVGTQYGRSLSSPSRVVVRTSASTKRYANFDSGAVADAMRAGITIRTSLNVATHHTARHVDDTRSPSPHTSTREIIHRHILSCILSTSPCNGPKRICSPSGRAFRHIRAAGQHIPASPSSSLVGPSVAPLLPAATGGVADGETF